MIKTATCKVCGKEFKYKASTRGRAPYFCSDECRAKARTKSNTKCMVKRYHSDEEWRKKRVAQNVEGERRRRAERKEKVINDMVAFFASTTDTKAIRRMLEEKTRVKSECYAKPL